MPFATIELQIPAVLSAKTPDTKSADAANATTVMDTSFFIVTSFLKPFERSDANGAPPVFRIHESLARPHDRLYVILLRSRSVVDVFVAIALDVVIIVVA
jgi:hypothetical protein